MKTAPTAPLKRPNVFDSPPSPKPVSEPERTQKHGGLRSQSYSKDRRVTVRCPHCKEERKISDSTWTRSGHQPVNAWPCGSCRRDIAKRESLREASIVPGHNGCFPVRHKGVGTFRVNCRGSRVNLSLESGHDCPAYDTCQYYAACLDWKGFTSNGVDFKTGKRIYPHGKYGKLIFETSPGLAIYAEKEPENSMARSTGVHGGRGGQHETCSTMAALEVV